MKKIAIIPNTLKDKDFIETKRVIEYLNNLHCVLYLEDVIDGAIPGMNDIDLNFVKRDELFSLSDFIIALGGDGTIIEIAIDAARYEKPILGINLGTLGFLTQIEAGNYSAIDEIINGNFSITKCMMLDIEVVSEDDEILCRHLALNDLILTGESYKMITTLTRINGTSMGSYSADGIIVSTAIGSTAYSLSAGGAVMHPEVDAMIITPICPHTLKARSTVIPAGSIIEITQEVPYRTDAVVRADGNIIYRLKNCGEKVRVHKSEYSTLLIKLENTNFFDVLRNKLSD